MIHNIDIELPCCLVLTAKYNSLRTKGKSYLD